MRTSSITEGTELRGREEGQEVLGMISFVYLFLRPVLGKSIWACGNSFG